MKPLVQILWHDSRDADDAWTSEVDAIAYGEEPCEIFSVGYLVSKGTKFITIAGDWNPQDKDYGRLTKVPVGMVISITELSVPQTEPETPSTAL